jgi:ubiquinone/menaquinone biosynthesis C-methylase UbiE
MKNADKIREEVRRRYANVAQKKADRCECSPSCCSFQSVSIKEDSLKLGYSEKEIKSVPDGSNMGLGCGNPQIIANLREGETVLDLGCGGGFDCFLAAKQVGSKGYVIGVDMTLEMIIRARENARKGNYGNVEFRPGELEHIPVDDNSVDVIISNCVVNLSPDKPQVFAEAFRVLKPGGRIAISDIVAIRDMPEHFREDMNKYTGCIGGAISVSELQTILENTGFTNISIQIKEQSRDFIKEWFPGTMAEEFVRSAEIQAGK